MAAIPAARMLFELGVPAPPAATRPAEAPVSHRCGNCRSEAELRAETDAAYARGVAEGRERGRSERIQTEQEQLALLVDEQNARLSVLAHEALGRLEAALEGIRTDLSNAAARALVAFFQGKIELEAATKLSSELRNILAEHGAARVTVRGPQAWIDQLAVLPEVVHSAGKVDLQANNAVDVTINIDGTVLETTLGEWLKGLGGVI